MSMSKLCDFFKDNGPILLSIVASVGVVATTVLAIKATPKAEEKIRDISIEAEPSKKEVVAAAWKCYVPTAIVGGITIGCIIGSNAISRKQQAAVVGAYILLARNYKQYRDKVIELFGEEADEKVQTEIVKDVDISDELHKHDGSDICLFYEEHYGEIFERSMLEVLSAEYEMNRCLIQNGEVSLNNFFDLLALDHRLDNDDLGWSQEDVFDFYQNCWIDFEHIPTKTDDGMEVYAIVTKVPPVFNYSQIPPWNEE